MDKIIWMMNVGYDLDFMLTGDKSTYYIYLSHVRFGNYFAYGYGKTLDDAVDMAFGLCGFDETHPNK